MFWNSGPSQVYGRFLRSSGLKGADALIHWDGRWGHFFDSKPDNRTLAGMSLQEIAEAAGCEPTAFPDVVTKALREWRVSPSRSLVNIVASAAEAIPGGTMFPTVRLQSQLLAAAIEAGAIRQGDLSSALDENGKPFRVTQDCFGMTAVGEAATQVNNLARAFLLWEWRNRALVAEGNIKLPKRLYRGIRENTIPLPDGYEDIEDVPSNIVWCERAAARAEQLRSGFLADVSKTPILSFTANERIAEFFTKNEGYVISVDPAELSLVSSWSTDEALAGPDLVTGRQEREWIMRLPNDYVLAPDNVRFHHRDVFSATADPRGIAMLDGTIKAFYRLHGHFIEAYFAWNSTGTGGSIRFRVDGGWSETRATIKKTHGFDPMPGPTDEVSELVYRKVDPMGLRPTEDIAPWEPGVYSPAAMRA